MLPQAGNDSQGCWFYSVSSTYQGTSPEADTERVQREKEKKGGREETCLALDADGDFLPAEWGLTPFFATSLGALRPLSKLWASASESVCPQNPSVPGGPSRTALPSRPCLDPLMGLRDPDPFTPAPSSFYLEQFGTSGLGDLQKWGRKDRADRRP